jgi:hypothetical protein
MIGGILKSRSVASAGGGKQKYSRCSPYTLTCIQSPSFLPRSCLSMQFLNLIVCLMRPRPKPLPDRVSFLRAFHGQAPSSAIASRFACNILRNTAPHFLHAQVALIHPKKWARAQKYHRTSFLFSTQIPKAQNLVPIACHRHEYDLTTSDIPHQAARVGSY